MKMRLAVLGALMVLVMDVPVASAHAGPSEDARSRHQQTVDFWTPERVRAAVPRDFVFDGESGRFVPAKPGNGKGGGNGGGNGGGKGDSTAITGAPWELGGLVTDVTGKVLFELSGSYWVCSATVVNDTQAGRSLVLTAAHCAYENTGGGEFASNWMFIPNYDAAPANLTIDGSFCDATLYGCWTASALVVHDGFASAGGFNGTAILHDFAFGVLEAGGKTGTALFEDVVTADAPGIAFSEISKGTTVNAFGYPHAAPYVGTDLTYCAGSSGVDNRLFKLTYKLACDMTGGSSGGGWYASFDDTTGTGVLTSLTSYGYSGKADLYGPKFNADTESVYTLALTAVGSSIAGP